MNLLFRPVEIPEVEGELLMPLHQLPLPSRLQVLETMPTFTARGLEGEASADAAPVVEDDDDIAKYPADSEEDEDAEATAASASAGGPSSSRMASEGAVLEISSGDEEEFAVAPSRRITEGGEEEEEGDQDHPHRPRISWAAEPSPRGLQGENCAAGGDAHISTPTRSPHASAGDGPSEGLELKAGSTPP